MVIFHLFFVLLQIVMDMDWRWFQWRIRLLNSRF